MTTAAYPEKPAGRPTLHLGAHQSAPLEGTIVEHPNDGRIEKVKPGWLVSKQAQVRAVTEHAKVNRFYAFWVPRGYANLVRRWADGWTDDYPHMIRSARAELGATTDVAEQTRLKSDVRDRRADYLKHRLIYTGKNLLAGGVGTAAIGVGTTFGGLWVDIALATAGYITGAWQGRPGARITGAETPQLDTPTAEGAVSYTHLTLPTKA